MGKQLAFVLSGGGARGALQAGALRALVEAGYRPDILTGTSIGAANAAFLGVNGTDLAGVEKLQQIWRKTVDRDLMPSHLWWQMMRLFLRRPDSTTYKNLCEFAAESGISPDLCFRDLQGVRLYLVSSDLNAGCPVVFGCDPNESVLEGMLASMTLPPWLPPLEKSGRYLVDGGLVSNLPIETAVRQGAEEIIALDLSYAYASETSGRGLWPFLWKMDRALENRQLELELEFAKARGVQVRYIALTMQTPVAFWDFSHSVELMQEGYELARQAIAAWRAEVD